MSGSAKQPAGSEAREGDPQAKVTPLDSDAEAKETPPPVPSFGALLGANFKVLLGGAGMALLAFLVWKLLAWLFPEIGWLKPGG